MKHIFFIILLLAFITSSCDKMPCNGDLDGMWQLMSISNDSIETSTKDLKIYYSFQLHLLQLNKETSPYKRFYAHFNHSNDSLKIYDVCEKSDLNIFISNPDTLKEFGITELKDGFKVNSLNSKTMILEKEGTTLTFRKF